MSGDFSDDPSSVERGSVERARDVSRMVIRLFGEVVT